MTCEQMTELLPDHLQKRLSASQATNVEQHLRECSACMEQVTTWKQLGELENETPSPALRKRFDAMLAVYQEGRWEHEHLKDERPSPWAWLFAGFRSPLAQAAVAIILLAAGIGIGRSWNRPATPQNTDMAKLSQEVSSMRQLLVVSMLQQQSASERLQGVSYSYQLQQPDPETVSALVRSLKTDSSVDVRLAALDSLRRYQQDARVRSGLADALQPRQSPLVQIALIDALVEMRVRDAISKIQQLEQSPDVNPVVKQRAKIGLAALKG
jgi:hypothetical protein